MSLFLLVGWPFRVSWDFDLPQAGRTLVPRAGRFKRWVIRPAVRFGKWFKGIGSLGRTDRDHEDVKEVPRCWSWGMVWSLRSGTIASTAFLLSMGRAEPLGAQFNVPE